jgi:hypothetical protein
MIDAAIVGLGRWGRTLVEAVEGKSDRLRFTHAVSRDPDKLRDYAAGHRLELVSGLEPALSGCQQADVDGRQQQLWGLCSRRSTGDVTPCAKCGIASRTMLVGTEVMTTELEMVVDRAMG